MNRLRARTACDVEDQIAAQIRLRGRSRPQAMRFVRFEHMQSGAVGVRVDGHGRNAGFTAGPLNAQGNLATVGDENLFEHYRPVFLIEGFRLTRVSEQGDIL